MYEYVLSVVPNVPMYAVFAESVDPPKGVRLRPVISLDQYVDIDEASGDEERLCAVMVLDDAGRMISAVNLNGFVGLSHSHPSCDADRIALVKSMLDAVGKVDVHEGPPVVASSSENVVDFRRRN